MKFVFHFHALGLLNERARCRYVILSQRNWKQSLFIPWCLNRKKWPLSLSNFRTAIKRRSGMQVQHLESGKLASTLVLSPTTAMEDPHVSCIPTQKNTFLVNACFVFFGMEGYYREIQRSALFVSEKVIFWYVWSHIFLQHVLLSHFCHALTIPVCFRVISLIDIFQLKSVLTSGNLNYKT